MPTGRRHSFRPGARLRAGGTAAARHRRREGHLARRARRGDEPGLALARPRPHGGPGRGDHSPRQHRAARHRHARPAAGRGPLARVHRHRSGQCRPATRSAICASRSPARRTSSRSRSCASACPAAAAASCRASCRARPRRRSSTAASACAAASLVRFLGWASANALAFDAKGDGPFGVRSRLSIAAGHARRARSFRRPVGNGDPRGGTLSLGGTAGAVGAGREPAARCARLHPRGSQPRRHPRRHPAWSAAAGERPHWRPGWRPAAGLAQRPDRRSDPRQRRAAPRRVPHLPRRRDGDRAQGRTPARAAAQGVERRRLQPRARGRSRQCRHAPQGRAARRDRRRVGAGDPASHGVVGRPRHLPSGAEPGRHTGAAQAGGIDGARGAHADLDRPRARRRGCRRHRQAQRAARWRQRRLAHGPRRCDGPRRGRRLQGGGSPAGARQVTGWR